MSLGLPLAAQAGGEEAAVVSTTGVGGGAFTRLHATAEGARLDVPHSPADAWRTVREALERLGVDTVQQASAEGTLTTQWVSWKVDAENGRAVSDPGFFRRLVGRAEPERHRFALQVRATGEHGASVHIRDQARQVQVDRAPDSTYAWMVWRERPVQPEAAALFMRQLQGVYELAANSRLVVERAVPRPAPPERIEPAARSSGPAARRAGPKGAAGSSEVPAAAQRQPQAAPASPFEHGTEGTAPAHRAANALWLNTSVVRAWDAIERALEAMGVSMEFADIGQGLMTTGWVEARFDVRRERLAGLTEASGSSWAFGLFGRGRERHRFQLMVVPGADGGSVVRAYHIRAEELVDRTPDSVATQLAWEAREPSRAVAAAFLKQLSSGLSLAAR